MARSCRLLNERQMRCDVPLNLTATSLITHAYLLTGDDRLRRWVLDYLQAWAERIAANGGICPDNVGPNGIIGETMGGKWWGGYYGWRWPHGFMSIIQPLTIAAMNAVLLTGDMGYLGYPARPARPHDRDGPRGRWGAADPQPPPGRRLERLSHPAARVSRSSCGRCPRRRAIGRGWSASPNATASWDTVAPGRGKGDDIHIAPWYRYIQGRNPDYPLEILRCQYAEVARRMDVMAHDDSDPETWDVHHWQDINPVHTEALLQLTCGGPQIIYHGGLLHTRLRYFDAEQRRPGLPADVGALVDRIDGRPAARAPGQHQPAARATAGGAGRRLWRASFCWLLARMRAAPRCGGGRAMAGRGAGASGRSDAGDRDRTVLPAAFL